MDGSAKVCSRCGKQKEDPGGPQLEGRQGDVGRQAAPTPTLLADSRQVLQRIDEIDCVVDSGQVDDWLLRRAALAEKELLRKMDCRHSPSTLIPGEIACTGPLQSLACHYFEIATHLGDQCVWKLMLGFDEQTPGAKVNADNRRKNMVCVMNFVEVGHDCLELDDSWFVPLVLRAGFSRAVRGVGILYRLTYVK